MRAGPGRERGAAPGDGAEEPSSAAPPAPGPVCGAQTPALALQAVPVRPRVCAAAAKPQYPGRARRAGKGGRKLQLPGGFAEEALATGQ